MYKLSIITINRNNAIGLERTIESVINQTFSNYEYIIIDGGSEDDSVSVIKKYDHKIDYWISEPDKGIYNAMNKGILKAKGEYLLFLNSGDWFYNTNVIDTFYKSNANADIVAGNIMKDKNIIEYSHSDFYLRNLLVKNIPHQAMFIKRRLFIEVELYNEELKILADYSFNLKMCILGKSYSYLNQIISFYDTTGISSNDAFYHAMKKEQELIFDNLLPKTVLLDYSFFLNKKGLNHPAIHWLIQNKFLFKVVKGLSLIFK